MIKVKLGPRSPQLSGSRSIGEQKPLAKGDYVVATKYPDGDPGDQFCIGFYDASFTHGSQTRHLVTDGEGHQFRHGGFRRVKRISAKRGSWLVEHLTLIESEQNSHSVWYWVRRPLRTLPL